MRILFDGYLTGRGVATRLNMLNTFNISYLCKLVLFDCCLTQVFKRLDFEYRQAFTTDFLCLQCIPWFKNICENLRHLQIKKEALYEAQV